MWLLKKFYVRWRSPLDDNDEPKPRDSSQALPEPQRPPTHSGQQSLPRSNAGRYGTFEDFEAACQAPPSASPSALQENVSSSKLEVSFSYFLLFDGPINHGFKVSSQNTQGTQTSPVPSEDEYGCWDTMATLQPHLRREMIFLMQCIRRELRGEASEGANDYFESELRRYIQFCSQYKCDTDEYKKKMLGGNNIAQRQYLIFNMQGDLIKLLFT